MNQQQLIFGVLAIAGVVIVAMAISANETGAKIIQWGLAIAILGVLLRQRDEFFNAWNNVTHKAIGITQQQAGS